MTLALLLTAVTGAWAQTAFGVKEITADMLPKSWSTDNSAVTADDLAQFGFMEVTKAEAQAWTGAPQQGNVRLIYTLCESVNWVKGEGGYVSSYNSRKIFYSCLDGQRIFITTELTEWDLTPDTDKKVWTLAEMPASNVELQVEYEPTKVTMAVNDKTMGTAEVCGESKVEWTADTWKGWTFDTKEYTVDDITMTSSKDAYIQDYTKEGKYLHSLSFFVATGYDNSTVTFSTTGDPFSRIEFTMIDDYETDWNPNIKPNDNWTFEGKSAVWEGEATKSLTLQSCSTNVSKITFFKGAIPDGVTVNGDGTFTVAKTATVTLTATPAEGYKFLYWEDDQTNTNPVREVTIESGMADMTYTAVFEEITYNVTFVEGTDLNEWTATPNTEVKKDTKVDIKYTGTKKVIGVKVEKKGEAKTLAEATSEDIGKIVGADGKIYATKADAEAMATGNAVAVIAYVGSETGDDTYKNGLAIALADESNSDWSTAKSTCEGKTPTVTGAKWCLPSQDQWKQMFKANGGNEGSYTGLNATITTAGGTALKEYGDYWSSEEEDPGAGAWDVYLANGSADWFVSNEERAYQVRACLAF